jgi:hypothetical protein
LFAYLGRNAWPGPAPARALTIRGNISTNARSSRVGSTPTFAIESLQVVRDDFEKNVALLVPIGVVMLPFADVGRTAVVRVKHFDRCLIPRPGFEGTASPRPCIVGYCWTLVSLFGARKCE